MDREHPDSGQPFTSGLTMTLRDYFAGQVIIGCGTQDDVDWSAEFAYRVADAMLKAREVKP